MPRSLARLSASASSHRDLSLAVFITNIAESDFRYTQHPRQAHCPGLALAECVRGETDRRDPTGMSRPHDRIWGGAPASDPGQVCRLLSYYNESRIHRSLNKDAPFHRAIERVGAITSRLSSAVFITNITESDFRYTQPRSIQ